MTLKQAGREGLDVYFFNALEQRAKFAAVFESLGRAVMPFTETVEGFELLCLAVIPRRGQCEFVRAA